MRNAYAYSVVLLSFGILACGDDTSTGGGGQAAGGEAAEGGGGAAEGGAPEGGGGASCDTQVCITCDEATTYTSVCIAGGADKSGIQAECEENLGAADAACQAAYDAYVSCWDLEACEVDCDDELAAAEDACGAPVSFY